MLLGQFPPVQILEMQSNHMVVLNTYFISVSSPSHFSELMGTGWLHDLVFLEVHEVLHMDGADQADQPPLITHSGFSSGFVLVVTQS